MRLIQKTGLKHTKQGRRMHGLFYCPQCQSEIEKTVKTGTPAKFCSHKCRQEYKRELKGVQGDAYEKRRSEHCNHTYPWQQLLDSLQDFERRTKFVSVEHKETYKMVIKALTLDTKDFFTDKSEIKKLKEALEWYER